MTVKWISPTDGKTLIERHVTTLEELEDVLAIECPGDNSILLSIPGKELAYSMDYGY